MDTQKKLVKVTLILLVLIIAIAIFFTKHPNSNFMLDTSGQPVLGEVTAPVYVVAFESLECPHCKRYMETIFPELKKQYIDTGKVKYTPILISFSHDDAGGQAAYCAQKQNSAAFFSFIDAAYQQQPAGIAFWPISDLLAVAKSLPEINTNSLQFCLERGEYAEQMEKNIAMLNYLKVKGVPTLFVNGIEMKSLSQESLFQLIDDQLAHSTQGE